MWHIAGVPVAIDGISNDDIVISRKFASSVLAINPTGLENYVNRAYLKRLVYNLNILWAQFQTANTIMFLLNASWRPVYLQHI